ncbi:hypothetical protein N9A94_08500, partial [Akkermansiaceae bacterium]|nr:hypothetical protein [Akkermansiaceae bacterium]
MLSLSSSSCVQFFSKNHSYRPTSPVEINGAKVSSALKAMGGESKFSVSAMVYSAGSGTLDGPFLWRVEAEGQSGIREWLRVNEVRVATSFTKRRERFPSSLLRKKTLFITLPGQKERNFAKFQLPGKLSVMPRTDGKIILHLSVTVSARGKEKTKWIRFELEPETKKSTESIFLPSEIV